MPSGHSGKNCQKMTEYGLTKINIFEGRGFNLVISHDIVGLCRYCVIVPDLQFGYSVIVPNSY